MKKIIWTLFIIQQLSGQTKINLNAALRLCNKDSNLFLKSEAQKISAAKPQTLATYQSTELSFKKEITQLWLQTWYEGKKVEILGKHYGEIDSVIRIAAKNQFAGSDMAKLYILNEDYFIALNKYKIAFSNHVRTLNTKLNTQAVPDFSTLNWIEKKQLPALSYDTLKLLITKTRNDLKEEKNKLKLQQKTNEAIAEAQNAVDLLTLRMVNFQFSSTYLSLGESDALNLRSFYLNKKVDVVSYMESEKNYINTRLNYFNCMFDFFSSKIDVAFDTGIVKNYFEK